MVDLGVVSKPKVATHFDSIQLFVVHVEFRLAFRLPNYSNDLNNFNYMSAKHTGQKVSLQFFFIDHFNNKQANKQQQYHLSTPRKTNEL